MKKEDLLNHAAVVVSWSFSDLIDKKGTLLIGMVDRKGQSTVVNAFTGEDAWLFGICYWMDRRGI